jgi:hypothetical protein
MDLAPVTESKLRELFERFGNVLDVTINRADFHVEISVHSGFGFIHYELDPEGVRSALTAIEFMHERVVNGISLSCTVSHGLETYLKNTSLLQPTMQHQIPSHCIHTSSSSDAYTSPGAVGSRKRNSFSSMSFSPSSTTSSARSSFTGIPASRSFESTSDFNNSRRRPSAGSQHHSFPVSSSFSCTSSPSFHHHSPQITSPSHFSGRKTHQNHHSVDSSSSYSSAPHYSGAASLIFPSTLSHNNYNNNYDNNDHNPYLF